VGAAEDEPPASRRARVADLAPALLLLIAFVTAGSVRALSSATAPPRSPAVVVVDNGPGDGMGRTDARFVVDATTAACAPSATSP
jgi:hypothetical protein